VDISGTIKPGLLFKYWADCVFEEFLAQGDEEKALGLPVSPMCDRETTNIAQSQISFMTTFVKPCLDVLATLIPHAYDELIPTYEANLLHWEES